MRKWNRDLRLLALASGLMSFGFAVYLTTFNNFIVQDIGIQPHQFGLVEALRELPGFLTIFLIAMTTRIPAHLLSVLMLLLMGIGIAFYSVTHTVGELIMASFVWSIGFHAWIPQRETLALTLTDSEKGKGLGQLRSVDELGSLIAMVLTLLLLALLGFRRIFILAGVAVVIGGIVISRVQISLASMTDKRFVFSRKYLTYYLLTFFQGCRRQIFVTFAVFSMVFVHGVSTNHIIVLMIVNTLISIIAAPMVGRLIDRLGERKILSVTYMILFLVFWGYSWVKNKWVLYCLYLLDRLLFLASVSLSTYLNRISRSSDLRPTLSLGVTLNHIAAVILPLIGGFLWDSFGYALIFQIGAGITLVFLFVVQKIRPSIPEKRLKKIDFSV